LLIFSNTLDLRALYYDINIHSGCGLRKWCLDNTSNLSNTFQLEVNYFGVDSNTVTCEDREGIEKLKSIGVGVSIIEAEAVARGGDPVELLRELMGQQDGEMNQYLSVLFNIEVLHVADL
jgi:hypothetical protein